MQMNQAVVPGPCGDCGCPPPSEIDCIEVTKVYDSCYQTETFNSLCSDVPHEPWGSEPHWCNCRKIAQKPGTVATCAVTATNCSFVSSTPTGVDDFAAFTFAVTVTLEITLTAQSGATCSYTVPVNFLKTVTLCAPTGVSPTCNVSGVACGPCALVVSNPDRCDDDSPTQVCCQLTVCLVLQTVATVQLLVPSYGFCVPAPCSVLPIGPCPPSFPANCSATTPTGA
jgi:hypothetical protein